MAAKPKAPEQKTEADVTAAEEQIIELSKRIEFYLTEYTVELLAAKMQKGDFVVPGYQREYTWEEDRKSRFIESVMIGLPIPFLFFWEMPNGRLEIVDGSQRLRTLEEFVSGGFRLGELSGLTHVSGFTFAELPESRQRKIKNRSIRGIVLNEHADEQARFDLFDRINTGSKIANTAEVRRGALAGSFMKLISELAVDSTFVHLAPVSVKEEKERAREELVTRFFGYGDGLKDYKDRPSEFLFNYVKGMNERVTTSPGIIDLYKSEFTRTMKYIARVFPYGFRKSPTGRATPKARFEAIAIGTRLALSERPVLEAGDPPAVSTWLGSDEFSVITGSDGANAIGRLQQRLAFVRDKLLD
jgi:Protein of unknown function DUF262